ncbi:MAG: hypothetical protein V5B36_00830 [Candidatus Accumulibacter sp. UW25]|jgi:hypothetical protein
MARSKKEVVAVEAVEAVEVVEAGEATVEASQIVDVVEATVENDTDTTVEAGVIVAEASQMDITVSDTVEEKAEVEQLEEKNEEPEPAAEVVNPQVLVLEAELTKLEERIKEVRAELKKLNKVPADTKAESKISRCRALYQANNGLSRKDMVALFMQEVGLSLAASRTYYQILFTAAKANK